MGTVYLNVSVKCGHTKGGTIYYNYKTALLAQWDKGDRRPL